MRGDLVQLGFVVSGAEIGKTGVQSDAVIEGFDIVEDSGACLSEGGKAVVVDKFIFETAPEGFN